MDPMDTEFKEFHSTGPQNDKRPRPLCFCGETEDRDLWGSGDLQTEDAGLEASWEILRPKPVGMDGVGLPCWTL